MKSVLCLVFLLALFQLSFQQSQVDRLIIDSYDEGETLVLIVLNATITAPNTLSSQAFYTSTQGITSKNILGGERDLQYTVESGVAGRVFSTSVSPVNGTGQWEISTPNGANGLVLMQYDGIDGTMNLNTNGFGPIDSSTAGGIDITESGKGVAFHLIVETDIDTAYTFRVYSPTGSPCTSTITVRGGNQPLDTIIPFSGFTTGCDFNNVGAIEVYVDANQNVDTITTLFTSYGDPDSGTPSPSPSPSLGASPSPSPALPGFTWYTVDDDFDRYPCEGEPPKRSYFVSNQNIVYYYFYKFDEYVNAYYGSQLIVEISSSPAFTMSLLAGFVALLALV